MAQIGMRVDRADDRQLGTNYLAHQLEPSSIGIGGRVADGRAMRRD